MFIASIGPLYLERNKSPKTDDRLLQYTNYENSYFSTKIELDVDSRLCRIVATSSREVNDLVIFWDF